MKHLFLALVLCLGFINSIAQRQELTYYLPDIEYDQSIPTPESVLGYQIGEWHLSHDQQYMYMRMLAESSPRVQLVEYARSYEHRPLIHLIITSEKNHQNLDQIKAAHVALSDPNQKGYTDVKDMPVVVYQGFSIHGNEPSGGNAAPLVAYYLAAGKSAEVDQLLNESVILLDPCFNPDGFHRFSTWVNMHKNKNLTADNQDREYTETWPRGRTNHYWFDLNRDWLLVQHPESKGRIEVFHDWKPNILTDHHEMGTNSTFFFMPGEPQRTNPITPQKNQELTGEIADYHAKALDEIGSLYYSAEGFDDFYYGKGSTYPDANACIGILFEQGSSRGHLQESVNGEISFPFTIRNQVKTALSTQAAAIGLRSELLNFQQEFYQTAIEEARGDERKAFVFGERNDQARVNHFLDILLRHQIEVYEVSKEVDINGKNYEKGQAYMVPTEQAQYRLIRGVFETMTTFQDSLFYDVSSWTLPHAFNIPYTTIDKKSGNIKGKRIESIETMPKVNVPDQSDYAYLFDWGEYYAPKALNYLLKQGLLAKVSTKAFAFEDQAYRQGTIMVPVANQKKSSEEIYKLVKEAAEMSGVTFNAMSTGYTPVGIDLGSNSLRPLKLPKVMLVVGDGVSGYEAGEVWHLLDQRYDMELVMIEADDLDRRDLRKYNTIILVDGSYAGVSAAAAQDLKNWLSEGGTLVATKRAVSWVKNMGMAGVTLKNGANGKKDKARRPYDQLSRDNGAKVIGGAIFEAELDLTHPLGYGFNRSKMPVFRRGLMALNPSRNQYATPMVYTNEPLLSGYTQKDNIKKLQSSATIVVSGLGAGKVICMADNPNFRAFWFGTNKLMANAIFFGHIINRSAIERVSSGKKD